MAAVRRLFIPARPKPYLMAHRGNRRWCPENTLAAFRRAVRDGADIIETDLRFSKDGEVVCIHDASVDRTTDGCGEVAALSLSRLKALSAYDGRPGYEKERIPTLDEFLHMVPEPIVCALELKTDDFLDPDTCRRVVAHLDGAGTRSRTLVLSFSLARLETMRRVAPDIPTGLVTLSRWRPAARVAVLGPYWPLLAVNPLYVAVAHGRLQSVCPLDPEPDSRLWYYCLLGCDAVLTDDCGTTGRLLRRYRRLYALIHSRAPVR